MSITGEELYREREQRFNDVVALGKPDRVPVVPLVVSHYFANNGRRTREKSYFCELRTRLPWSWS